jgi:uncharacterized protein
VSRPTTDKHNPLVSVQEFPTDNQLQVINSYGDGGFRIAKQSVTGSQFVFPRQTADWPVSAEADIDSDDILARLKGTGTVLLLLGLGERPQSPLPELAVALREQGIKLEVMSTSAACRTWNVLLTEGRAVAAGLIATD